jgi:hypothetical protein
MDRGHLKELHYIAPIGNLASVAIHGILSHRRAQPLKHQSVAMQEIQDVRAKKRVPGGRALHEYANLYVNGRNPMLFKRSAEFSDLVVLRVKVDVLDLPDVVVTDQNAASDYVRFAAAPLGLAIVSEEYTFAEYWTHPEDPIEQWRHKSRMCAEVLVPDFVPAKYITGAYAASASVLEKVSAIVSLTATVNRKLFFR